MSPKDDNSHTMIDTFPDPFAHHQVVIDDKGNPADYVYIYVNFAFEVMTGLNRDDIIGQKVTGILPTFKDSVFDWISIYDKLTTINKTTLFEHFSERTGQWCEITTCSDEPGSFAVLFRNITEQKKVEIELKESTMLLQHVYDGIQEGISVINTDLTIRQVNRTIESWHEQDLPLKGKKCYQVYQKREEPCERCPVIRCMETGKVEKEEVALKTDHGEKWIELFSYPLFDVDMKTTIIGAMEYMRDITERKNSEKALRESEESLSATLYSIGDGVIATDADGCITRMNYQAERFTGWSFDDAEGRLLTDVFRIISAETGETAPNPAERVMETGHIVGLANDTVLIARDGTRHQIADSAAPIRDSAGNIDGVIMVFSDVTEQYKSRQALKESEEKYRKLFENSSNAIIIHDKDSGAILDANSKALDLYGFSKIEDLKNNDFWLDPPYSFKEALGWIHKAAKEGPQLFQWLNRKKSGELFWEEVQLNKIIIDGVEQILSTSVDITERKEAQENLSKNKEFYELLLGSTHDPLHVVDSNLIIVFANKKFNNDLKLYANNISIPGNPLNKVCPFLPDHAFEEYRTVFNNGKPLFTEESTEIEGITFYTETTKSPVFDLDGKVSHVITVVRNISERKEAEEALKKSEDELAKAYRQLNEEINKAAAIHNRILPDEIPETQAISIAAHYQPATRMGGDSYNVIKSGNKLIVYLSDVMGHGLDGALISVFVKEAISSYITLKPEELNPQKILQHLSSQYYCENYPDEQLICIFLGVIDLATMNLSYAGAGFQTEPLIKLGNGKKEKLNCGGIFISNAVPPEILKFEERNITLTPGTTILITTDGLAEQESGEDLFYRRYEDIFYEKSHLPPKVIVQAINRDFCMFNGNSLTGNDDISYLVLQHNLSDKEKHHLEIKSSFEGLESLYNQIKTLTANYPENYNLTTCLHELICNAIEHGNKLDPDKKVTIDLEITQQYIFIEVEDQGEGFNWCEKIGKQFDLEGGSERGRGIPLLRILSANVYYNQKGNRASLLIETN